MAKTAANNPNITRHSPCSARKYPLCLYIDPEPVLIDRKYKYPHKIPNTARKVVSDPIHKWTHNFCCIRFQTILSVGSLEGMDMSQRLQLVLFNFCWFRMQAERRGYVLSATDFNSIAATSVYWIVAALTSFTHQSNGSLSAATITCVGSRHDLVCSESALETLKLGVIMAESPNQTKRSIWPESQ